MNKKLKLNFEYDKIEELVLAIISEADEHHFIKSGKNIYKTDPIRNIRLTINSYTNRIITADKLSKKIMNS